MIQSILFWTFLLVTSILLFPVAVLIWALTAPFDRRRRLLHRFTCFWASLYTWLNPVWPVRIIDRHKLVEDEPVVLVANHLSLLDILVLFRLFSHFKWVSKAENFRVPLIGWNMRLNRYIQLHRGVKASVVQMMRDAERALAEGSSIMMFPEGTRSPNGRMRRFKPGAFELAQNASVPIQPLVIQGSADALPKAGFVLRGKHRITVTVLEPVAVTEHAGLSVAAVSDLVRGRIAQVIGETGLDEHADRLADEPPLAQAQ